MLLKARKLPIIGWNSIESQLFNRLTLIYSSRNHRLQEPVKWVTNFHLWEVSYGMKNANLESGSDSKAGSVMLSFRCHWNQGNEELLESEMYRILRWVPQKGILATAPSPKLVRSKEGVEKWKHKKGTWKITKMGRITKGRMTPRVDEVSAGLTGREFIKCLGKDCPKNWNREGETTSEWLEKESPPFWARVHLKGEGIRLNWFLKSPSSSKMPPFLLISVANSSVRLAAGTPDPAIGHRGPLRHDHTRSPHQLPGSDSTNGELFLPDGEQESSHWADDRSKGSSHY